MQASFFILFPVVLTVLLFVLSVLVTRSGTLRASPEDMLKARSERIPTPQEQRRTYVLMAIVGIVALAGGIHLFSSAAGEWTLLLESQRWARVEGMVVSAEIEQERQGTQVVFLPDVVYRYTVEGVEYTGTAVHLGRVHPLTADEVQYVTRTYTPGSPVTVYYDPLNPANAVLERRVVSTSALTVPAAIPLMFLGVFLLGTALGRALAVMQKRGEREK